MNRLILVLIGILLAYPAHANNVIWMSGLDSFDTDSTSYDSFEFVQGLASGAEDADIQTCKGEVGTCIRHKSSNGGNDSSQAALEINVTANEQAYYEPADAVIGTCETLAEGTCTDDSDCTADCRIADSSPFPLDLGEVTVAANFHLGSVVPSGTANYRTILEMRETGDQLGCNVRWNEDREFELYYNTEELATPSFVAHRYACASYLNLPCSDDSDCPGGAGSCTADGTPTGIEFWSGLELTQRTLTPDVECTLRVNGKIIGKPGIVTPTSQSPANITTFRIGATRAEDETINFWVDDLVVCEDNRCGWGYVATLFPTSEGVPDDWGKSGSSASNCTVSTQEECLDDYKDLDETPYSGASHIQSTAKSKTQVMDDFDSDVGTISPNGDNYADALDVVAFGFTATTSVRELSTVVWVDSTQVPSGDAITLANDATYRQLNRVVTGHPDTDKDVLAQADIESLEWQASTGPNQTGLDKISAVNAYVHVRKPDAPLIDVIMWGNEGVDDAYDTVLITGDSTSVATLSLVCLAGSNQGERCSINFYCSWDSTERDKSCPEGDDEFCRTCSLRASEVGGIGYPCDLTDAASANWTWCGRICDEDSDVPKSTCADDSDCPNGTCLSITCGVGAAGICDNNSNVTCTDASDCEGLGNCQTTATCVESCPGSACPARKTWADNMIGVVKMDNLVQCGIGAWNTKNVDGEFENYLDGDSPYCNAVVGTVQPADIVISLIGTNDAITPAHDPNCEGKGQAGYAVGGTGACSPASQTNCMDDSDCSGVHADSVCIGRFTEVGNTKTCISGSAAYTGADSGSCTVSIIRCGNDADCSGIGIEDCSVDDTAPDSTYQRGGCKCDPSPDSCPVGYTCLSNICHKSCATNGDADCSDPEDIEAGMCNTGATPDVCYGTCTTPSDDIPCTTDADCTGAHWHSVGQIMTFHGSCTTGGGCGAAKCCERTGFSTCIDDATCVPQFLEYLAPLKGHHFALDYFDRWQGVIDALSEGDKTPIWIALTVPDTPDLDCKGQRGSKQYIQRTNMHLLNDMYCSNGDACLVDSDCSGTCNRRFPFVVDIAKTLQGYDKSSWLADNVHFNSLGAQIIGERVADFINAFNTCAANAGTPDQTVQRYCRSANNAWTDTTCDDDADCTAIQTCQIRPCVCDCTASVCDGGVNDGAACSVDSDCCAGGTCTSNICNDDCSGSTCNKYP